MKRRTQSLSLNMSGGLQTWNRKLGNLLWRLIAKKGASPDSRQSQSDTIDNQRPDRCSVRKGCEIMNLPRSTYYCHSTHACENLSEDPLCRISQRTFTMPSKCAQHLDINRPAITRQNLLHHRLKKILLMMVQSQGFAPEVGQ